MKSERALEPLRVAGLQPPALTSQGSFIVASHMEIEGVHFDPTYLNPLDLGRKALACGLFRLAACRVAPLHVQVSTGVNIGTTEPFLDEVFRGMSEVARPFKTDVQLGNSVHSPTAFFLGMTFVGKKLPTLPKARVGDILAVTGTLGAATAGLHCLRRFGWPAVKDYAAVVRPHLCPTPPLAACLQLMKGKRVSGAAALVDGLASDLHLLLSQSKLGAEVNEDQLPVSPQTREAGSLMGMNSRHWALFGGEDFQLLVSVPPRNWKSVQKQLRDQGVALTAIGELRPSTEGPRLKNLEGEKVKLANRSWSPLVRKNTR